MLISYSSADLKMVIDVMRRLNKKANAWNNMVLINPMMHNLESFVELLIEEKYVTN